MLKERVLTALLLVPLVLWCIFGAKTAIPFMSFAGALVMIGAWEWTALMGWKAPVQRAAYLVPVAVGLVLANIPQYASWHWLAYAVSVGFWSLASRCVIFYPASVPWWANNPVLIASGFVLLIPAWLGLVQLYNASPWWLFYLFGLVWGADTGAYFAGRAFGKNKLAPRVSPGKTIEGLVGGIAVTMSLMAVVAWYRHLSGLHLAGFAGLSLLTVLASVMGDLLESMVKRHAGVKDSGTIFPGHGGALDRIDSLTAAAPIFALGWWLSGGF